MDENELYKKKRGIRICRWCLIVTGIYTLYSFVAWFMPGVGNVQMHEKNMVAGSIVCLILSVVYYCLVF